MLLGTTSSGSSVSTSILVDFSYSSFGRFGLSTSAVPVAARQVYRSDSGVLVSPRRWFAAGLTLRRYLRALMRGGVSYLKRPAA
jgi:hypothetical protein